MHQNLEIALENGYSINAYIHRFYDHVRMINIENGDASLIIGSVNIDDALAEANQTVFDDYSYSRPSYDGRGRRGITPSGINPYAGMKGLKKPTSRLDSWMLKRNLFTVECKDDQIVFTLIRTEGLDQVAKKVGRGKTFPEAMNKAFAAEEETI